MDFNHTKISLFQLFLSQILKKVILRQRSVQEDEF